MKKALCVVGAMLLAVNFVLYFALVRKGNELDGVTIDHKGLQAKDSDVEWVDPDDLQLGDAIPGGQLISLSGEAVSLSAKCSSERPTVLIFGHWT